MESASFPPARYCTAMSEQNVETVRRVYEGVNARLEAPRELFDPLSPVPASHVNSA